MSELAAPAHRQCDAAFNVKLLLARHRENGAQLFKFEHIVQALALALHRCFIFLPLMYRFHLCHPFGPSTFEALVLFLSFEEFSMSLWVEIAESAMALYPSRVPAWFITLVTPHTRPVEIIFSIGEKEFFDRLWVN